MRIQAIILTAMLMAACGLAETGAQPSRPAVLVELFTSEGCSSCPPAEALLESIDRANSAAGPGTVVLSEHVDYWNQIGWTDPFSSSRYSDRQRGYAGRFRIAGIYTPQMVVDGAFEFVGSDRKRAKAAIERAAQKEKPVIALTARMDEAARNLRVRVEIDAAPASFPKRADVYLALASNEETSQVLSGENGGRQLHHVAVARNLAVIGQLRRGEPFAWKGPLDVGSVGAGQWRVVAFLQEHDQGRVLGAVMRNATQR